MKTSSRFPPRFAAALLLLPVVFFAPPTLAQEVEPPAGEGVTAPPSADPPDGVGPSAEREAAYSFVLARMLAGEGELIAAEAAFEEALALAPDEPYLRLEYASHLTRLASVTRGAGRTAQLARAVTEAKRARDLALDEPAVWRTLAEVYLDLAREDPTVLADARQALEKVVEAAPDDLESALTLGQVYLSEDPQRAADLLTEVAERTSGNRYVYSLLSEALIRSGRRGEARDSLARLLAIDPGSRQVRLTLAELESDAGEHERAAELLAGAPPSLRDEPEVHERLARELFLLGRYDEAERLFAALPAAAGADSASRRSLAALLAAARGDDAGLAGAVAGIDASDPRLLEIAAALREQELNAAAESVLTSVLARVEAEGDEAFAARLRLELAETRFQRDDVDGAVAALASSPRDDGSGRSIALEAAHLDLLLRAERDDEARALIGRALERREPHLWVLLLRVAESRQRYHLALPLADRALGELPEEIDVLFLAGVAYERTGDVRRAADAFQALIERSPRHPQALNYLGYMWAERGENLEQALALVERALAIDPDNGAYLDSLGWVYFQMGRHESALEHLERAAELEADPVVLEHLGDAYQALGRSADAAEAYTRSLDGGHEEPKRVEAKLRAVAAASSR